MNPNTEKFKQWLTTISEEQAKDILLYLFDFCRDAEYVNFGDHAPYYRTDGEPFIQGQKVWDDC
jgi:hypothetical protein